MDQPAAADPPSTSAGPAHLDDPPAKVLVVDDMAINLQVVAGILKGAGMEGSFLPDGSRVVEAAAADQPDVILLDVMMPGLDGFSVCRALKADARTSPIPVIFLTALSDGEDVAAGFDAGGVDYVTKPFRASELVARIRAHVGLRRARQEAELYAAELADANRRLEDLASRDPLTGLPNRREAWARLEEEESRSVRSGRPWCLASFDIDFFKKVNDTRGHACGDAVLLAVSRVLSEGVRTQDLVARWGGEEFVAVLPETPLEGALVLAEKLRAAVAASAVPWPDGEPVSVTITVGVAQHGPDGIDGTLERADAALYRGKAEGRDRVVAAPPGA